jgi:hypothetical protein
MSEGKSRTKGGVGEDIQYLRLAGGLGEQREEGSRAVEVAENVDLPRKEKRDQLLNRIRT